MNKLIERLLRRATGPEHLSTNMPNKITFDVIKALEAADRMAKVTSDTLKWPGDIDFMGMNEALTTYRNLTQETPHAG